MYWEYILFLCRKTFLNSVHWKGLESIVNSLEMSNQVNILWSLNTISHDKGTKPH